MCRKLISILAAVTILLTLAGCLNGKKSGSSKKRGNPLNLSIMALNDNASFNMLVSRSVLGLSTSSATDPVIEGFKVSFKGDIYFCTGVYGVDSDCSFSVYTFSSPVEVDLTQNVADQLNVSSSTTLPSGSYSHATLQLESQGAVKAYYVDGSDVVYTTSTTIKRMAGATPGADYDYYLMADIYSDLGHTGGTDGYSETTYFDTPFEYDGSSTLDLKIHLDLLRSGSLAGDNWNQHYLSIFMTFEDDATVRTYELDAGTGTTATLTLVLNSAGELVGGRTRGVSFDMQQFLKNWSCASPNSCSFEIGDFGTNIFDQSVTGFDPEAASGSFSIMNGESSVNYTTITR